MKSVWIIMSPEGGFGLNIFTNKGTVYANKERAEKELEKINNWSRIKGYGTYELVELEVEDGRI